jgi:hypothetical protein
VAEVAEVSILQDFGEDSAKEAADTPPPMEIPEDLQDQTPEAAEADKVILLITQVAPEAAAW